MAHVKAHRTKKVKQKMSLFEWIVVEGKQKPDDPAKNGATLDGGEMAQIRARGEVCAAVPHGRSYAEVERKVDFVENAQVGPTCRAQRALAAPFPREQS